MEYWTEAHVKTVLKIGGRWGLSCTYLYREVKISVTPRHRHSLKTPLVGGHWSLSCFKSDQEPRADSASAVSSSHSSHFQQYLEPALRCLKMDGSHCVLPLFSFD